MQTHDLKTWPEYFRAVEIGAKTFEIRNNDRNFKLDDFLKLREYDPRTMKYTGNELRAKITYITNFNQPTGQLVMGIVVQNSTVN